MKSIITGGAGFLGCHLAEYLVKLNHKVIIIDNFSTGRLTNLEKIKRKVKIVKSDISKDGSWKKNFNDVDWVFHFASLADIVPSIENPKNYFSSNVNGTLNVLQACRKSKPKKFIYAASSSCYGIPKKYPTPETAEINPQYPYALTKRLGEELVIHWHKVYKLKAISLRFFNLYGTRSRTDGTYGAMFGVFLGQKLVGLPFTVVGDGNQKRDFIYIDDCLDIILWLYNKPKISGIFNAGTGTTRTFLDLTKILFKNLKKKEKIKFIKTPKNIEKHYQYYTKANISKLRKVGYLKKIKRLEDGIKHLIKKQKN